MSGSYTKNAKDRNRQPGTPKNRRKHRPFPVVVFFSSEELDIINAKWPKYGFQNRSDHIRFVLVHGVIDEVSVKFHVNASIAKKKIRGVGKGAEVDNA